MKAILLILFFLSGAAGLSYEVAWTRSMVYVFGNTNLAMGLVLSVFLLGFFVGSLRASRVQADRSGLLLRLALVEGGIGLMGLVVPLLISLSKGLYPLAAQWVEPNAVRFLVCVLIIFIPTCLMGATFPLMNGIFITRHRKAASGAGLVYGMQTLGAATGTALSGFVLIQHLGLVHTSWVTAGVNGFVALAALLSSRVLARPKDHAAGAQLSPSPEPEDSAGSTAPDSWWVPVMLAVLFCAGFASLALEVLWTRILVFFVDGLTYSFTAMLVVYLVALAAGSALLALWDRLGRPGLAAGGLILVAGGLATIANLFWIPRLYDLLQAVKGDLAAYGFADFMLSAMTGSALIIFLPALCIGMATPLAIGVLVRVRGGPCRESGAAYAASCLGCCAGALVASWWAVPWLGLKSGVITAGMVVLTAGVLLYSMSRAFGVVKFFMSLFPLALALFLALLVLQSAQLPMVSHSHVFKRPGREGTIQLKGYAEGNVCTASVVLDVRKWELRLYTDGFNAAATGSEYGYMRMMAHLPALACREPKRSLVIGYGTGTTAGSLSLHHQIEELDIVEISKAVMELAPLFHAVNHGVGYEAFASSADRQEKQTAEVAVHVGMDGRDYLNLAQKGFDLITLEPLMPYTPAAVHFYTEEFYQLCLEKLNPGGVVCQWIPLNALPIEDFELLLRTFTSAIPSAGIFNFENCLVLLGFSRPDWKLSVGRIEALLADEVVCADLEAAGQNSVAVILSAYICDGERVAEISGGGAVMHDDRTTVEFVRIAPGVESYRKMSQGFGLLGRLLEPVEQHVDWAELDREAVDALRELVAQYRLSTRYLLKGLEAEASMAYRRFYPGADLVTDDPARLFEKAFNLNPSDRRAAHRHALSLMHRAQALLLQEDFATARKTIGQAQLFAADLFELSATSALLDLASGDWKSLEATLDRMALLRPHSHIELALRAQVMRSEGRVEAAESVEASLDEWGGLDRYQARLLATATRIALQNRGTFETSDTESLLRLLKSGSHGVAPSGARAWSIAAEAGEEALTAARDRLLEELLSGGQVGREAAVGLGFFHDDEVVSTLRRAFLEAPMKNRPALLEALYRAGDEVTFLSVLASASAAPELLLKATEIAATLQPSKAITPLIDLLEHRLETVRMGAFVALIEITGRELGYDPYGQETERAAAMLKWRRWNQLRQGRREDEDEVPR